MSGLNKTKTSHRRRKEKREKQNKKRDKNRSLQKHRNDAVLMSIVATY